MRIVVSETGDPSIAYVNLWDDHDSRSQIGMGFSKLEALGQAKARIEGLLHDINVEIEQASRFTLPDPVPAPSVKPPTVNGVPVVNDSPLAPDEVNDEDEYDIDADQAETDEGVHDAEDNPTESPVD